MTTIQTTAHVGPDGVLRLEVPVPERDQDVDVQLTIRANAPKDAEGAEFDPYHHLRAKLAEDPEAAKWVKLPPPGRRRSRGPLPVDLPGPSASEILIRDRR